MPIENDSKYRILNSAEEEIVDDYIKAINTQDYLDYIVDIDSFYNKLNLDSYIEFSNEIELKEWIYVNINLTDFKDIDEIDKLVTDLIETRANFMNSNSSLFDRIAILSEEDRSIVFETIYGNLTPIGLPVEYVPLGPCENECINDGVDCWRSANEAYAEAMAVSTGIWAATGGLAAIPAAGVALVADINHRAALRGCVRALNACMRNCG